MIKPNRKEEIDVSAAVAIANDFCPPQSIKEAKRFISIGEYRLGFDQLFLNMNLSDLTVDLKKIAKKIIIDYNYLSQAEDDFFISFYIRILCSSIGLPLPPLKE